MISSSLGKILLIVACALGFIQGLMFLIGGIIATKDRDKDLDGIGNFLVTGITDTKYFCGAMMATVVPDKMSASDDDCDVDYDEMDRGWFKRVYDFCDLSVDNRILLIAAVTGLNPSVSADMTQLTEMEEESEICKLRGYKYVLALSITCGVGWIIGAGLAILALIIVNKIVGFIAGGVFAAFYIVFIVLFALIWDSVRSFNDECLNDACTDVKKHGKKSSIEVLAYSICAFVLICGAIVCSFLGALGLAEESAETSPLGVTSAKISKTDNEPSLDKSNLAESKREDPKLTAKDKEESKVGSNKKAPPKKPAGVSLAGKEYIEKFKQLNKYIADKNKMDNYAEKKFNQTDTDKSGTIEQKEFKDFVIGLMTKKSLPPPSDRKIQALMKRYDTDKNGTLEKGEFREMLLEIFLESRTILISKYAEKKASSWKSSRAPKKKDTSGLAELEKLLQNDDEFYAVLEELGKKADVNMNSKHDIDEVHDLLSTFSGKYKVPALSRDDIVEIMFDMERDIVEYDLYDLRMVAYAALSISCNLIK